MVGSGLGSGLGLELGSFFFKGNHKAMFVHHQGFVTLVVLDRLRDGIDPVLKNVPIIPGLTGTIGLAPIMAHEVNLYPTP